MIEDNFLKIDGAFGEGGGAVLRVAAAFSYLFNVPIRIKNIRANRPKPGLRTQHLIGLKILAQLTNSQLSECKVGTEELTYTPNQKKETNTKIHVNINTAASIGLLLQPTQIASLGFKQVEKIEIILLGGGSFGKWAPSVNYLKEVTYKIFRKSGLNIEIEINKHGFYPKGGARIVCTIHPSLGKLSPIILTELGNIDLIHGEIIITNQLRRNRENFGIKIKKSIQNQIRRTVKIESDIKFFWVDSTSPGIGVSLWAHSDTGGVISSGTILGQKGVRSKELGIKAANEIIKYIKNDIPIDDYLSDQLIPLMAYVKKPSRIKVHRITNHARTNLELIKLFTRRDYHVTKKSNSYIIDY